MSGEIHLTETVRRMAIDQNQPLVRVLVSVHRMKRVVVVLVAASIQQKSLPLFDHGFR